MNSSEQLAALEAGKRAGLPASRVFVECGLPASRYACFLYDEYWAKERITTAKLLETLRTANLPEIDIWQYCHSSLVERLPKTRALVALELPFIKEFSEYSVEMDRRNHGPVGWLDSLTRQIHQALPEDINFFFAQIAETILNGLIIQTPTTAFRITELEFYYNGRNHPDHYTHSAREQLKHLHWYFNQAASLDLIFGDEATNSYGGILVRGMCALAPETAPGQPLTYPYFIGPQVSTRALVASWGSALDGATSLQLRANSESLIGPVWSTARVGLKSNEKDEKAQPYTKSAYRFIADEDYLKRLPGKEKLRKQLGLDKGTTLRILGYKPAGS